MVHEIIVIISMQLSRRNRGTNQFTGRHFIAIIGHLIEHSYQLVPCHISVLTDKHCTDISIYSLSHVHTDTGTPK